MDKLFIHCISCGKAIRYPYHHSVYSRTLRGELCYVCIENDVEDTDSTDFKLVIPHVNEMEHDLIMNGIGKNEDFDTSMYGNIRNIPVPVSALSENCKKIIPEVIPDVLTSLVVKGLIVPVVDVIDGVIQLTAEGYWYYLTNEGE